MEHVGLSEEEARQTCDLKQCEQDKEGAIKLARSMGIEDKNIRIFTEETTDEKGIKVLSSAKQAGKSLFRVNGLKHFKPYSEDEGSFLFVYCAGHGAGDRFQHFLLNATNDVAFNIENNLRVLSEACNVTVCAVYDICAVSLDAIKPKLDEGDRAVANVGKEYSYMHLGVTPGQTVPADSTMC